MIDSTYLQGRKGSIVAVMDSGANAVLAGAYGIKEGQARMGEFCAALADRGLCPRSITTDGHRTLLRRLRALWPTAILQRCLVHIQRQGLSWCRRYPKRTDAKHLRELFLQITAIDTATQRDRFLEALAAWENRYGQQIARSPEKGWVFSDLKRARSMLLKALPHMFYYLHDPAIPRTTNGLEGYFSRLKMRFRQHRGLAPRHRANYFQWYFHLCQR